MLDILLYKTNYYSSEKVKVGRNEETNESNFEQLYVLVQTLASLEELERLPY